MVLGFWLRQNPCRTGEVRGGKAARSRSEVFWGTTLAVFAKVGEPKPGGPRALCAPEAAPLSTNALASARVCFSDLLLFGASQHDGPRSVFKNPALGSGVFGHIELPQGTSAPRLVQPTHLARSEPLQKYRHDPAASALERLAEL